MKIVNRNENIYTLSFAPGEEIVSGLLNFARNENINAGHITGLGATNKIKLSYFDLDLKKYKDNEIYENMEILSLVGNIALDEKKETIVHIHGVFGRSDFNTIGGHVKELIISAAGEIHLIALSGEIRRKHNEKLNLHLLD